MYDFFFFNDTATTEIYTLSLHDALPISTGYSFNLDGSTLYLSLAAVFVSQAAGIHLSFGQGQEEGDRKSTRLNSSHQIISYAVFCLKKKKQYLAGQHEFPSDSAAPRTT